MNNIIEQSFKYYVRVTGNDWHKFYDDLDEAMKGDINTQTGDIWLIHALANNLIANNIELEELKYNKDTIKSFFDNDGRKSNGEFFTPEIWAKEGRTYFEQFIPNWKEDYYIWDICAGTGNLLKTVESNDRSRLFLSTLQDSDVITMKDTDAFKDAIVFQYDFLSHLLLEELDDSFINELPEKLRDVILNDKPLIIYANPPYRAGKNKATEVGRFMSSTKNLPLFDFTDFSAPAYDIFYQFCFQVMCLVIRYKLKNTYFGFFGPLRYFVGKSANVLLKHFEHTFEFLDGMCLSASEFNDLGEETNWGISCTLWKSRGDYLDDPMGVYHKDILLEKKITTPEGDIESEGRILYEPAKKALITWSKPSQDSYDFYIDYPLMTSTVTFKGGNPLEKTYYMTGKVIENFLGTLMVQSNLIRNSSKCAVLSAPTTIDHIDINRENFWRCVPNFTVRAIGVDVDWTLNKKELSAPNTNIEGYEKWLHNCLPMFLFGYRSMMSSIRNVVDKNGVKTYDINNNFFYVSPEEFKENCEDKKILEDFEKYYVDNSFMLKQIEIALPDMDEPALDFYEWCKSYTLASYNYRYKVDYKASLECWNAGFQQIRNGLWNDTLEEEYRLRLSRLRDYLKKDIYKWGFLSYFEE